MYKVGDLFQAKDGFIGAWINNNTFVLIDIDFSKLDKDEPYTLYCQQNGRTLNTGSHTLRYYMTKVAQ